MNLRQQIEAFEGRRYQAYPDPLTGDEPWTIGVGHTGPEVHQGLVWTDEQIDAALAADLDEATEECVAHCSPWFQSLNEERRAVIIGMFFQLGAHGALSFKQTLGLVRDERFADAAEHLRQSLWGKQTPKRVNRLASQLETGNWA